MTRTEIAAGYNLRDIIILMAEGNPGALRVLTQLAGEPVGLAIIINLDDMNIRGSQIWVAYKDYCRENLHTLIIATRSRDQLMVECVNNAFGPGDHKATVGGASRVGRTFLEKQVV